jgi:hypothetical protein
MAARRGRAGRTELALLEHPWHRPQQPTAGDDPVHPGSQNTQADYHVLLAILRCEKFIRNTSVTYFGA